MNQINPLTSRLMLNKIIFYLILLSKAEKILQIFFFWVKHTKKKERKKPLKNSNILKHINPYKLKHIKIFVPISVV
jgi:hypothetical protein